MSPNRFRFPFRYIPLFLVLICALLMGSLLLSGGMRKVYAWNFLPLILPACGAISLVFALVRLVVRLIQHKRIDRVVVTSGLVGLLGLLPALQMVFPLPYPASISQMRPEAIVRLPADVPLKVLWGGDTQPVNYHVIAPDQRWAYDFGVAPYLSGSSSLDDYGCYGIQVLAPASGVVTVAHDGEPDAIPGNVSNNIQAPEGNHVVIRMDATGTYLAIAHLKPGSVLVSVGQHVEEGQPIGQCGNSGNTSEPHIHIHHQRQDPAVYPINFAEGLPLYFKTQDGVRMPNGGFKVVDGTPEATGDTVK
mgnify:CR=1 FL=1